jgi:N6-adenosine-specific RNA methylase IME4
MSDALAIIEEVSNAIQQNIDPVMLAVSFLPKIESALELVQSPQEAGELRHQADAINTYIRKTLPSVVKDRHERYGLAEPGTWAHLLTVHKHGELWNRLENQRPSGQNESSENFHRTIGWQEAGFSNPRDKVASSRVGEIDVQDLEIYREAQQDRERYVSINGAESIWKRYFRDEEIANIEAGLLARADGLFDVIVVDPPWPYGTKYNPDGRRAANPYPEKSLEEIKEIEIAAADDCVLWLWTTHKFMRHSFEILDHWGFRDVSIVTWAKDRMGLGSWLRSQSEFCIMAVKGKPMVNLVDQTTVIYGPMREHSRKPDEFYDLVDDLCLGRKLDWFSREAREGWEQIGNEVDKFDVGRQES